MINFFQFKKRFTASYKGKRPIFITIDGDGFNWKTQNKKNAAEIFLHEIIEKYPFFKFTISIIIKDIFHSKKNINLIRKINSFHHVEPAAHSWNHPSDWQSPKINLEHEITNSIKFINKNLTHSKKVKIFLWTGKCNPNERALSIIHKSKVLNLNGNEIFKAYRKIGPYQHFMSRSLPDWHYLKLRKLWPDYDDPEILRLYPGNLGGYKKVIGHFKANPQLPIHLWLHWYSASRIDSLAAVKKVLDWCLKQDLKPIFASDYVKAIKISN